MDDATAAMEDATAAMEAFAVSIDTMLRGVIERELPGGARLEYFECRTVGSIDDSPRGASIVAVARIDGHVVKGYGVDALSATDALASALR